MTVGYYIMAVSLKESGLVTLNLQISLVLFHDRLLIILEFLVEPEYLKIVLVFLLKFNILFG